MFDIAIEGFKRLFLTSTLLRLNFF